MKQRFRMEGDTWEIGVEQHALQPELDALVFHCMSDPQRPYRVIPLPADLHGEGRELDRELSADRLRELFARSQPLDFTHDPEADPRR
jgi:hypothetical protein